MQVSNFKGKRFFVKIKFEKGQKMRTLSKILIAVGENNIYAPKYE